MSFKTANDDPRKYKLVPPDGGWGYVTMASYTIYMITMASYVQAFGLLYAEFLLEITGDKAYGISLTNTILFTSHTLSGFLVHILVHHLSIRKIGIAGSTLYFLGALSSCFMENMIQMIFFVSICQGIGTGLITIAVYSAFFSYFSTKINFLLGISFTITSVGTLLSPYIAETIIRTIGFRKSLWVVTAMAASTYIFVGVLQPVERHLKKVYIDEEHECGIAEEKSLNDQKYIQCPTQEPEITPLSDCQMGSSETSPVKSSKDHKRMSCSHAFDFSLLRSYIYWSVAIGTSSVFFSEFAFVGVIPAILGDIGFEMPDVAIMMVIYFVCDLCGRVCYSVLNFFYKTRSRYIYLAGTLFTAILRTLFSLHNSYAWRLGTLCIMGFVRGFLQITVSLSIAEEFKEKFASAFSLMMAIGGICSLAIGLIASYVKQMTKNNVYILHILTMTLLVCVILWPIEFVYRRKRNKSYSK